ncbi:gamma-glutamyl-gamma-aminobutyrate hydrolase family protein [Helicobacter sp. MIT 11-5569]|uniref:gamma-glutamyl-CDP-amidate hydrolase n=1 Tax=Helicobacter sp. MIT 11-5569 TaxID=1548151 RepID=UPI00051FDC80|nr:gamma-glutamyl-CDP-amidate hydrolase [Helicobacter sp. MIT 11-5569]TLD81383.1 gamma-glutamyl-gamma-aminobutyrate hydrolase family protein [Helicobacter sp. MIT 11-5569]
MKFIAISQRIIENDSYVEIREALSCEWGEFFQTHLCGFLPLPLSYAIPFATYAKALGESLAGVILSGGNDLSSLSPNPNNLNSISKMRDDYEGEIIAHCMQESMPLLGICRGTQRIAEYFGSALELLSGHVGNHQVMDSKNQSFIVNSFHRYGITALGDSLQCLTKAQDESIEAFSHKLKPIFGLMWHIERANGMENDAIFQEWFKMVKANKV